MLLLQIFQLYLFIYLIFIFIFLLWLVFHQSGVQLLGARLSKFTLRYSYEALMWYKHQRVLVQKSYMVKVFRAPNIVLCKEKNEIKSSIIGTVIICVKINLKIVAVLLPVVLCGICELCV